MNKEHLLTLTGTALSCAPDCPLGLRCFGGWAGENEECEEGIGKLQAIFQNPQYRTLIMAQQFFGLRVFDATSEKRPLPVIGTILIEKGNLSLRNE